jgi:FkbM family methyltransferase
MDIYTLKKEQVGNCEVFYRDPDVHQYACQGMKYEAHINDDLRRYINKSVGFLDIGANVGIYQAKVKTWRGLEFPTVAVEVNPDNAALLLITIKNNGWLNTDLIPLAAWSSIAWKEGNRCWNTTLWSNKMREVRFLCAPLDLIPLKPFDVVKLDTEGTETEVLAGMEGLIRRYKPVFFFEYNPPIMRDNEIEPVRLLQKFIELGYKLTVLDIMPGMRAEFDDAQQCADHIAKFPVLMADIMAEHGNH